MWILLLVALLTQCAFAEQPIRFDPEFLKSLPNEKFQPLEYTKPVFKKSKAKADQDRWQDVSTSPFAERNFQVFIELFRQFSTYVKEFERENDRVYGSLGDFKAQYQHAIFKNIPWAKFQAEVFRFSAATDQVILRVQGGGAGVRVDLGKNNVGRFSFLFMPLYGEQRQYRSTVPVTADKIETDYILRYSAGVAFEKSLKKTPAGVRLFYQPQIIDLGQYRVYAETYIRFKVYQANGGKKKFQIQEIYFIPKLLYWYSSDQEGLLGDAVQGAIGPAYESLDTHFMGFFQFEFKFSK